jgi:hypothetical protein
VGWKSSGLPKCDGLANGTPGISVRSAGEELSLLDFEGEAPGRGTTEIGVDGGVEV